MAKDPAVLFYTSDFLTGTILMNYEQKGKYITLLCIQHQHGIIDKNSFDLIVGNDFMIKSKFLENTSGFYNQRMLEEANKRREYCQSRSANKLGKGGKHKKNISKTYDKHMENENEDEDINGIGIINATTTKSIVSKKTNAPQQEVYEIFATKYLEMSKQIYKPDKKDFICLADLIKKTSKEQVIQKIEIFEKACKISAVSEKSQAIFWFTKEGISCFTIGNFIKNYNSITPFLTDKEKEEQKRKILDEQRRLKVEEHFKQQGAM